MRKLLITLDDDLDKVLAKYPNQSEIIRESLRAYIYDITTDTVQGIRKAMKIIINQQENIYEQLEKLNAKIPDQF